MIETGSDLKFYIHVHRVDELRNSVYEAILIVNRSGTLLLTG